MNTLGYWGQLFFFFCFSFGIILSGLSGVLIATKILSFWQTLALTAVLAFGIAEFVVHL